MLLLRQRTGTALGSSTHISSAAGAPGRGLSRSLWTHRSGAVEAIAARKGRLAVSGQGGRAGGALVHGGWIGGGGAGCAGRGALQPCNCSSISGGGSCTGDGLASSSASSSSSSSSASGSGEAGSGHHAAPAAANGKQPPNSTSNTHNNDGNDTSNTGNSSGSSNSIFAFAASCSELSGPDAPAFHRVYAVTAGTARCSVGPELALKYGMERDNVQLVVSVTNRLTGEQAWFNEARTRKPQTFKAPPPAAPAAPAAAAAATASATAATAPAGAASAPSPAPAAAAAPRPAPAPDPAATRSYTAYDPTNSGATCDFCRWPTLTAEDTWGRVELPHAVTGSNLFKYAEPCHGLVLFKHHDPLQFSREQLRDFLAASEGWYAAAHAAHPDARHAFLIWNCLARAGASQYHGHGQTMLTRVPVPTQAAWVEAARRHVAAHPSLLQPWECGGCGEGVGGAESVNGPGLASSEPEAPAAAAAACDVLAAHRAAGLLRCYTHGAAQPAGHNVGPGASSTAPSPSPPSPASSTPPPTASTSSPPLTTPASDPSPVATPSHDPSSAAFPAPDPSFAAFPASDSSPVATPAPDPSSAAFPASDSSPVATPAPDPSSAAFPAPDSSPLATPAPDPSSAAFPAPDSSPVTTPAPDPSSAAFPAPDSSPVTFSTADPSSAAIPAPDSSYSGDRAWVAASLAPIKDMEVMVMGSSPTSPAFVTALHAALRALIDDLGCNTFNVGVYNIDPRQCQAAVAATAVDGRNSGCNSAQQARPWDAALLQRSFKSDASEPAAAATAAASAVSNGDQPSRDPQQPLSHTHNQQRRSQDPAANNSGSTVSSLQGPVIARVVSRGRMGAPASDFGCLEVVGGASIGHTDPFRVIACVEERLRMAADSQGGGAAVVS